MPMKALILVALATATMLVWEPFKRDPQPAVDTTKYLGNPQKDLTNIPLEIHRLCAKQGGCFVVPASSFHNSMKAAYQAGAEACSKGSIK